MAKGPNRDRSGSKASKASNGSGGKTPNRSRGGSTGSGGSGGSDKTKTQAEINLRFGKNVGYVLCEVGANYLGSAAVAKSSGNLIAEAAVKRIAAQKQPTLDVQLVISVKGIFLINNKTGAPVRDKIAIDAITFVALSSTSSKHFSFISNNEELDLKTLHSFKATRGAAEDFPVAINEAFMVFSGRAPMPDVNVKKTPIDLKKAAKQKSKLKKKPPVKKDPDLVGAFEAKYLCSLAVDSKNGVDTVTDAWASASSIGVPQGTGCIMIITTTGIKTIDAMSQAPLFNTVIKEVSFTTACGPKNKIFAYISNNESSGRIVCHMYNRGDLEATNELLVAIGVAFKKAAAEAANPFIVKGKDKTNREKPPEHLMRRQIRRGHMMPAKLIGQGQFGQVWLGELTKPGEAMIKCAVKLLKGNARDEDKEDFARECEMMLQLDHPNLTIFLGCAVQQKPWLCVLEFLAYGDVKGVLEGCAEKKVDVSASVVLHYTKQTAEGMAFMANLNLVHMDLAARNVLLHLDNLVKIADFGLTHKLEGDGTFTLPAGQKLPMKWMAPEAMDIRVFSQASDVWAFAITTWEMFAMGAMPYPDHKTSDIQDAVRDGVRNAEPELMPEGMHKLLLKCWEKRPSNRPDFAAILIELNKFSMGDITGDLGKDLKAAKDKKAVAVKAPNAPPWYFGNLPKEACDKACLDHPPGSFLVRSLPRDMNKPPPGDPPSWCLTCNDSGSLKNFLIKGGEGENAGKFLFAGNAYNDLGGVVKVLQEKAFKGKNGDMTLGEPARKPRMAPRRGSVVRRPSTDGDAGAGGGGGIAPRKGSTAKKGGIGARKGSAMTEPRKSVDPKAAVKKAGGFDPKADTRWKKFPAPVADAEYSIKEGNPGDFVVLQDTDLDVYFIIAHATKTECATWTVRKEGGKCVFGRAPPQDTIEDIIESLMGVKLPAKGLKIELLRPGALKRAPGTPGARPVAGAKAAPAKKEKKEKKKKKTEKSPVKENKPAADEEGFGFDTNGDQVAGADGADGADGAGDGDDEFGGFDDNGVIDDAPAPASPTAAHLKDAANSRMKEQQGTMKVRKQWYVGDMAVEAAEQAVINSVNGDFLVRKDGDNNLFIIVKDGPKAATLPIEVDKEGKFILMTVSGPSLTSVIEKTIRASLQSPVSSNLLYLNKPVPGGRKFSTSELK